MSDRLYAIYWCDDQGYAEQLDFVQADSIEAAKEHSPYASGGVAHHRLLFAGTYDEFNEYVDEQLEETDMFTVGRE